MRNLQKCKEMMQAWKFNDWCIAYIVFFSIVYQQLAPLGFFAWMSIFWRNIEKKPYAFWRGLEFIFVLYYIFLCLGLLWTDNIDVGIFKLENKLSFAVFPLLFYFSKLSISKETVLNILLFSICFSLTIYQIVAISKSIYNPEDNHWGYFKGSLFCLFMHRGYYASYLVIGSLICQSKIQRNQNRLMNGILFVFLSIGTIQTHSKAGILCLLGLNTFLFFYYVIRKKLWKTAMTTGIVSITLLGLFINMESTLKDRFQKIPLSKENIQLKNNNSSESNQARLIMWSASIKCIYKGTFWGYGTGDDTQVLEEQNKLDKNLKMAEDLMNSHNQFFTTMLQIGLPGLFVLFTIFYRACKTACKNKELLTLLISLCFFINFLVESYLERQAGIILFCLLTISLHTEFIKNELESKVEN